VVSEEDTTHKGIACAKGGFVRVREGTQGSRRSVKLSYIPLLFTEAKRIVFIPTQNLITGYSTSSTSKEKEG
jgi:hypothetical protein